MGKYVTQLEALGAGEAARAIVGVVERAAVPPVQPVVPIFPLEPPPDLVAGPAPAPPPAPPRPPPAPPAPPPKPEEPPAPTRQNDSPRLQGSRFYIPIGKRREVFKILWDEWIRAGIGKQRVVPVEGEALDAGGRPRGMVIDPEALEYLPRAEVVVPGRDGSLLVPGEIMIDEEAFIQLLDQWGVGDRITIQVEGMYRAEGPVASTGVWRAPWRSFDDDEEEF